LVGRGLLRGFPAKEVWRKEKKDKKEEAEPKTRHRPNKVGLYAKPAGLHNGFYAKVWKEPDLRSRFA